jgi:hypothetical protein
MTFQTKFSVGQAVWVLDHYKVEKRVITGIDIHKEMYDDKILEQIATYSFGIFPKHREEECFETKEELINFLSK